MYSAGGIYTDMAILKDLLGVSINNLNICDYVTERLNLQNRRWILVTAAHPSPIATKHKRQLSTD